MTTYTGSVANANGLTTRDLLFNCRNVGKVPPSDWSQLKMLLTDEHHQVPLKTNVHWCRQLVSKQCGGRDQADLPYDGVIRVNLGDVLQFKPVKGSSPVDVEAPTDPEKHALWEILRGTKGSFVPIRLSQVFRMDPSLPFAQIVERLRGAKQTTQDAEHVMKVSKKRSKKKKKKFPFFFT